MQTTKVFQSGNSQAVRIPSEFQFAIAEVEIEKRGDELILRPPRKDLSAAFAALSAMPDDFCPGTRTDEPPQVREEL